MPTTELTDWHRVTGDDTPRDTVARLVGDATPEQIEAITRAYLRDLAGRLPWGMAVDAETGEIDGEPDAVAEAIDTLAGAGWRGDHLT